METNHFNATIENKEITVHQNPSTGLFYTILRNGRHTPVDYRLIRTQTTAIQRLKYWRNRYGYTQAELAKLVHVSSPTVIANWEKGRRYPLKTYRQLLNKALCWDIFPD